MTVPKAARTQAFIETGIYISSGKRCCKTHITGLIFSELALQVLRPVIGATIQPKSRNQEMNMPIHYKTLPLKDGPVVIQMKKPIRKTKKTYMLNVPETF
ncbi:unnamed protein product, partial [Brenthis ino]